MALNKTLKLETSITELNMLEKELRYRQIKEINPGIAIISSFDWNKKMLVEVKECGDGILRIKMKGGKI